MTTGSLADAQGPFTTTSCAMQICLQIIHATINHDLFAVVLKFTRKSLYHKLYTFRQTNPVDVILFYIHCKKWV